MASKVQDSSKQVLQVTKDQLIYTPLSHTHHYYEVGMLKVSAYSRMGRPGEVVNPARGQLNRKNEYSPVCLASAETICYRNNCSVK